MTDSKKGQVKIVNKNTKAVRWVSAKQVRKFDSNEWDIFTPQGNKASIEYLRKHNIIK